MREMWEVDREGRKGGVRTGGREKSMERRRERVGGRWEERGGKMGGAERGRERERQNGEGESEREERERDTELYRERQNSKVVSERAQKGVSERKDQQKRPGDKREDVKTTRKPQF